MARWARLVAIAALAAGPVAERIKGEVSAYWLTIESVSQDLGDDWKTRSHLQLRSTETDFLQYGRFSQKFLRTLDDTWTLGAHPAIEFTRSSTTGPWLTDYRVELEANGRWKHSNGFQLDARTRWELRLRQGSGGQIVHRMRQRFVATWELENVPFLKSASVANEIFFEEDRGQITANRFFPLMARLNTKRGPDATVYLMHFNRRSRSTGDWSSSYVVGLNLKL